VCTIQGNLDKGDVSCVFKLSDLKKIFCKGIDERGGNSFSVHSTRFKEQILQYFPELEATSQGREILLVQRSMV